jgi:hypothetical protein
MGKGKVKGKGETGGAMVRISTFVREDQLARLRQIQEAQGVPVAEQIRRALDAALGLKGRGAR